MSTGKFAHVAFHLSSMKTGQLIARMVPERDHRIFRKSFFFISVYKIRNVLSCLIIYNNSIPGKMKFFPEKIYMHIQI